MLEKVLIEVWEECDIFLNGLYGIYSCFGFVVDVVKKGMVQKFLIKGFCFILGVMKVFNFK